MRLIYLTSEDLSKPWLVGWIVGLISQINRIYHISRIKNKNPTSIPIDRKIT